MKTEDVTLKMEVSKVWAVTTSIKSAIKTVKIKTYVMISVPKGKVIFIKEGKTLYRAAEIGISMEEKTIKDLGKRLVFLENIAKASLDPQKQNKMIRRCRGKCV